MQIERNERIEAAMETLLNECNMLGRNNVGEIMGAYLYTQHRTIQQNFMREVVEMCKEYSTTGTDLRNEGAVELAKYIAGSDHPLPFV